MFKYATKELSQDAFICWLVNYINTDEEEYKVVARDFIKLIADKIGNTKFKEYIKSNDYKVEIKHQYKNMDILLKIGEFYIIIEDKIKTLEHDDQINEYTYKLIKEGIKQKDIFTCYYKIYDEYKSKNKFVNAIITRRDMISLLEKAQNKNLFMEDYYKYLKEIDEYSKKRDITTNNLWELKSDIVNNLVDPIYTSFYSELEEKEGSHNIIGWGYADNRKGGTWWYASKKYENVKSKEFDRVYAEINLKEDRNFIVIKLAKKYKEIILKEGERLEDKLDEEYLQNGNVKYYEKYKTYIMDYSTNEVETEYYCKCYKILKEKISIYNQVITEELLNKLKKLGIYENDKKAKGFIKEDIDNIYKYYTRIASINVNNYTLEEIEKILEVINKHLQNLKIEF